MNEQIKKLYQSVILKHNNEPVFFEKRLDAPLIIKANNPICGDRFDLFIDLENEVITNISFHGFGCAISKASSSVLVKNLKGKSIAEATQIIQSFMEIIKGDKEEGIEEFIAFAAAKDFPGRAKCASLAWDEMLIFLAKA